MGHCQDAFPVHCMRTSHSHTVVHVAVPSAGHLRDEVRLALKQADICSLWRWLRRLRLLRAVRPAA